MNILKMMKIKKIKLGDKIIMTYINKQEINYNLSKEFIINKIKIKQIIKNKQKNKDNLEILNEFKKELSRLRKNNNNIRDKLYNICRIKEENLKYKNSLTWTMYGKKRKDLTNEELKEYNKLKKREQREKEKIKIA